MKTIATTVLLTAATATLPATAQEPLGTLFTTPEQREYLDYLREEFLAETQEDNFNIDDDSPPPIPAQEEQTEQPAVPEYSMGGIFRQPDGSRVVWLNGETIGEADLPDNMELVTTGSNAVLRITVDQGTFELRPGQTLLTAPGRVLEAYERPATSPASPEPANETDRAQPQQEPSADGDSSTQARETAASDEISINPTPANDSSGGEEDVVLSADNLDELSQQASPEEIANLIEALQSLQQEGGGNGE